MDKKLNILLTGATGTVGYEVLKLLYNQREQMKVTVFDVPSKRTKKLLSPFQDNIEIVFGDISRYEDVKQVSGGKDFVIHLAAIIPPLADELPELAQRVNSIGTRNLVKALEQYSPKAFLLYSSSISVYGDRIDQPFIRVNDTLKPSDRDEYAKTKIKAEQIIQRSSLNWSIFRLTAIMGNHKITKLLFHMPLETPLEIATPKDAARAFVHALKHKEALSKKIFNLSGGKSCRITYKEFLSRSFALTGLGKLDFPSKAFAEKNFHCGYYADGDKLEDILHFRKDTIDDYFDQIRKSVPAWQKLLTSLFGKQVKRKLLHQSEPYQAFLKKDKKEMEHYFILDKTNHSKV